MAGWQQIWQKEHTENHRAKRRSKNTCPAPSLPRIEPSDDYHCRANQKHEDECRLSVAHPIIFVAKPIEDKIAQTGDCQQEKQRLHPRWAKKKSKSRNHWLFQVDS